MPSLLSRLRALLALAVLGVFLHAAAAGPTSAPVCWVVTGGEAAGLQLRADARRPYLILPQWNPGSGAFGEVLAPGLFRSRDGSTMAVALYGQLPPWQQHLSDALTALDAGRDDLAEAQIAAAYRAAAAAGDAAPECLSHTLPALAVGARQARLGGAEARQALAARLRTALLASRDVPPAVINGMTFAPDSLNFGDVCIGEKPTQSFTISNPAGAPARSISGAIEDQDFMVAGLPATLQGGQSVTVTVTFAPTQEKHYFTRLSLKSGDDTGQVSPIFGDGEETVALSPGSVNFGNVLVDESKRASFTIQNCTGKEVDLKLHPPDDTHFKLEVPFPTTIPAHGSVPVNLQFFPTKVDQYFARMMVQASIAGVKKSKKKKVQLLFGKGVGPVGVSATSVDFGTIPANINKTEKLTLTNNSQQVQTVKLDTSGLGTVFHVSQSGTLILQPGQSLDLGVSFGAISKCKHRDTLEIDVTGPPAEKIRVVLKGVTQ